MKRILILDGDENVRFVLSMYLSIKNEVESVDKISSAINKIKECDYDIIFIDHFVGNLTAEILVEVVKKLGCKARMIITTTANTDEKLYGQETLKKPFTLEELDKIVDG